MAGRRKPPVIRTDSALLPVQSPKAPAPGPDSGTTSTAGTTTAGTTLAGTTLAGTTTTPGTTSAGTTTAPGTVRINPAKSNVSVLVLAPEPADSSPTATVIEFPQPAGKRHRRTLWITLASVAAVVALVVAVVIFSPLLALKTITVDGNKLATGAAIQAALAPLKDKPLPQVDLAQVEKLLAPIPQIRSVSVEARPPSTLLVHLVEREPVALLKNDQQYIMVDPDGIQLGTTADPASVPLPIIDGGTAAIGNATFKAMTAVLAALPASILAKLAHASASSPDAVELTLDDGKTIVWGNASERELKAKVVQALVNAPPPAREAGKPEPAPVKVYDVSAPRHPVTR